MFRAKLCTVIVAALAITASAWAQGRGRAPAAAGQSPSRGQGLVRPAPPRMRGPAVNGPRRQTAQSKRSPAHRALGLAPEPAKSSYFQSYGYHPYYRPSGAVYPSYGWPYSYADSYWSYGHFAPFSYSPYFPYLYFYDLYDREAQDAERYWREREEQAAHPAAPQPPVTSPGAPPESDPSASGPLAPRDVLLTLDGEELPAAPSGGPVVLGSGRHALRISARPGQPSPGQPATPAE